MIQFSTCGACKQRFEQPNVALLLEPAKTQALARFAQFLLQHTAQAHPDRMGMIQASTMEFNGFLNMTQFEHTDDEFNKNTRKWGEGIIARVQEVLGLYSVHEQARITVNECTSRLDRLADTAPENAPQLAAIRISLDELRQLLDKEAAAAQK